MTDREVRYTAHDRHEPDGSFRRVYAPSEELEREQSEVLGMLRRAKIERFMPYAHGGVRGRSQLTNALAHQSGREFYKLDLWHAYRSVDVDYMKTMATVAMTHLTEVVGPPIVDHIVDTTVMAPDIKGLPTGFATSPMFFDIYCMGLDMRLSAISAENGLTYTRFADDLTFSGPRHVFASKSLRRKIRSSISEQPGGSIRDSKASIETMHRGVTITGIALTSDPEYVHPAKELLQAADTYISFCEGKRAGGQRLTEREADKLNGYNGVLHLAGHPDDSKSKYVRQLYDRYRQLVVK